MDAQKFNHLLEKIKYDKKAADAICEEYYLKVKAHVKWRFGKLIDPADATQDVFLKLLTADIPGYVDYPAIWMYTFADHCVIDALRAKHIDEVELNEAISRKFDLDDTVLREDVKRAMRHLDEEAQQILYMHFWEGYKLIEISRVLNISYVNVRAIVSRAYKILKTFL